MGVERAESEEYGELIVLIADLLERIDSVFARRVESFTSTRRPSMIRSASESGERTTEKSRAASHPAISRSPIAPTEREGRVLIHANGDPSHSRSAAR